MITICAAAPVYSLFIATFIIQYWRFKNVVIFHTLYDTKHCAFVPGVSCTCVGSLFCMSILASTFLPGHFAKPAHSRAA